MKGFRIAFVSIVFLSAIFFVDVVNARGGTLIVEPSGEATERVKLGVRDSIRGNFSVSEGFIDFYITNPSGTILLCYNKTTFNDFNLTAEEDGNYTMHLINSYQEEDVNVTLTYACDITIVIQAEVNVRFSVGTVTVISTRPPILDPDLELDDPYSRYLNFLEAHEILRIILGFRKYMPLQNTLFVLGCVALVTASIKITELVHRFDENYVRITKPRRLS